MTPPGFQFASEQQQGIYDDLLLFGDGPAAFFYDACRLVAETPPYKSTTHLVGHLLREIHSCLDAVLQPPLDCDDSPNGSKRKWMLKYLGFSETDFVYVYSGLLERDSDVALMAMAHRRQLSVRAIDETFERFWTEVQDYLSQLLDKAKDRLLDVARSVESLAGNDSPSAGDIKSIRSRLPHSPFFLQRFFGKLRSPNWLASLEEAGYFDAAIERIEQDGSLRFQNWPQSAYLARIAKDSPEVVREVILKIQLSNNDSVISDLADAALAMPASIAKPVVEKIVAWINSRDRLYVVDPIADLISHLEAGGFTDTAFELAEALLHVERPDDAPANAFERGPRLRIDNYLYGAILQEHVLPLAGQHPTRTLRFLCPLLDIALPPLQKPDSALNGEWEVFSYRELIAESPEHGELMFANVLIDSVRDLVGNPEHSQHVVSQLCTILAGQAREVFKRLHMYALARAATAPRELVKTMLLDPKAFDNIRLWPEFAELMRRQFVVLHSADKQTVLSWIARGPQGPWPEPNDPDRDRKVRHWKFKKLEPISARLDGSWRAGYSDLAAEFEASDREREQRLKDAEGWEVSPVDKSEFATKQVKEIVQFVLDWKPSGQSHPRASRDSLLRTLEMAVAEEPGRFVDNMDVVMTLDANARSHVISGIAKGLEQSRAFNWERVLHLCHASLDMQPTETSGDGIEHVRWLRQVIAQLALSGLHRGAHSIPFAHRDSVRTLVSGLLEDADPVWRREGSLHASLGGSWALAINSVRGYALQALFEYGMWCCRHQGKSEDRAFLPEDVWSFVESYLASHSSWDRTTHVVLGCWFPMMLKSDEDRALSSLPTIFPNDQHADHLFDAAWEGFIMHSNPNIKFLTTMQTVYHRAVQRVREQPAAKASGMWATPNRLGMHLLTYFSWGRLDFGCDGGLLDAFFESTPVGVRTEVIQGIGRISWPEDFDEEERERTVERYRGLMERRIAFFEDGHDVEEARELEAIGTWAISPYFGADWSLRQLERVLRITGRVKSDSLVLRHFETLVRECPREVLRCVELMIELGRDEWSPLRWHSHIRMVLEGARNLAAPDVREAVRRLINRMSTRGMSGLDDLLL